MAFTSTPLPIAEETRAVMTGAPTFPHQSTDQLLAAAGRSINPDIDRFLTSITLQTRKGQLKPLEFATILRNLREFSENPQYLSEVIKKLRDAPFGDFMLSQPSLVGELVKNLPSAMVPKLNGKPITPALIQIGAEFLRIAQKHGLLEPGNEAAIGHTLSPAIGASLANYLARNSRDPQLNDLLKKANQPSRDGQTPLQTLLKR